MDVALGAIALGGLACPAMMCWQHRRGRPAPCCPPPARANDATKALAARQAGLAAQVTALGREDRHRRGGRPRTGGTAAGRR